MTKAEQEKTGLTGGDKQQGDLQNAPDNELPEGLQRERKGPYDKRVGRNEQASQVPRAFPDLNPAKKKTGEF
jgi:hypothetical protein